jgi:hypothetical protein
MSVLPKGEFKFRFSQWTKGKKALKKDPKNDGLSKHTLRKKQLSGYRK